MNREEIHFEKIDTQKELLAFEEKHGRPVRNFLFFSSFFSINYFGKNLSKPNWKKI